MNLLNGCMWERLSRYADFGRVSLSVQSARSDARRNRGTGLERLEQSLLIDKEGFGKSTLVERRSSTDPDSGRACLARWGSVI